MACLEGELERDFRSKAMKKLDNVLEGFVHSLVEIAEAENLLKEEMDAAVHIGPNFLWQSELTHRLMAMLVPSVANLVQTIQERVRETQETLTLCDRIFSVVCDDHAPTEELMASLQLKTNTATADNPYVDVEGTCVSGSEFKAVKQRQADSVCEGNTCPHFCKDHHQLVDNVLWKKLPRELVERICASLPLRETIELQKHVKPWSRMPTFRQACAEAHPNLSGIFWEKEDTSPRSNLTEYQLAVFHFGFQKFDHVTLNNIPSDYLYHVNNESFASTLFGHDGGLVCFLPYNLLDFRDEELRVYVFNPLTGDEKYIPVSERTQNRKNEANLLLLRMDADGSYKLILVTRIGRTYDAESYDSKSGLWSDLDSGIVCGDGVFSCESRPLVFDCAAKRMYRAPLPYATDFAFVRDQCFVLDTEDRQGNNLMEVAECVWEKNKWNVTSRRSYGPFPWRRELTRLLVSKRHMLTVLTLDEGASDHRTSMTLFNRETHEERADVPKFLNCESGNCDNEFSVYPHSLFFMCDLSWDAVP